MILRAGNHPCSDWTINHSNYVYQNSPCADLREISSNGLLGTKIYCSFLGYQITINYAKSLSGDANVYIDGVLVYAFLTDFSGGCVSWTSAVMPNTVHLIEIVKMQGNIFYNHVQGFTVYGYPDLWRRRQFAMLHDRLIVGV